MYTKIKTLEEITAMRTSGRMLATVLHVLRDTLEPGMSTKDLANLAAKELKGLGGQPSFLGYQGFPDVLCVSLNNQVVHGIPSPHMLIQEGDIVSMDFGVTYDSMITDAAISCIAGTKASEDSKRLVRITEEALQAGIHKLHDNVRVGMISAAIQAVLDKAGYGIVRDLVGHGVGHELHEEPNIPNYTDNDPGPMLKSGMTIAIEPMATLGLHKVFVAKDGWTVETVDDSRAAHFEHTVLVTDDSYEILTKA